MITALRPIEVRTAAADGVPKVAAVLADAFINDPVFTWLLPGSLRLKPRLRTMFAAEMEQYVLPNGGTVWTTAAYDGAVTELPPGAWEMPKSATLKEALKWVRAFGMRLSLATRVKAAMEERHLRSRGRRSREPTLPGYRRTSRPAASAARHSTSGSASCTWMCLSCQRADRRCG
jgi:hypothetical protein